MGRCLSRPQTSNGPSQNAPRLLRSSRATILAAQHGVTIEDCIEIAWNEIKDRKGRMVGGTFLKESDL